MSEKIESQTVTMAHGAGGKQTSELIDKVLQHFANPDLTADDAAVLNPPVGKWQCQQMDLSYLSIFPEEKYWKTVYLRNSK